MRKLSGKSQGHQVTSTPHQAPQTGATLGAGQGILPQAARPHSTSGARPRSLSLMAPTSHLTIPRSTLQAGKTSQKEEDLELAPSCFTSRR